MTPTLVSLVMAALQSASVWLLLTAVSYCIIITVAMPLFWGILIIQMIPGPELGPWCKDREMGEKTWGNTSQ